MPDVNYLAITVATVAAFIGAFGYYTVFGKQLEAARAEAGSEPSEETWKVVVEVFRTLVLASVVAGLSANLGIDGWAGALQLALALWIAFPALLLFGSVMWENVPWRLAVVHAGEWLLKLVVIALIVGIWSG